MGALPKALAKRGHRVMVVVPRYANYENIVHTGVRHRVTMFGSSQEVRERSTTGVPWCAVRGHVAASDVLGARRGGARWAQLRSLFATPEGR